MRPLPTATCIKKENNLMVCLGNRVSHEIGDKFKMKKIGQQQKKPGGL